MGLRRVLAGAAAAAGASAAAYVGVVTSRVTIDLGIGRRVRPLGPLDDEIAAPVDVVYAVAILSRARHGLLPHVRFRSRTGR